MEQQAERIEEFTEHKDYTDKEFDHTGREFADVRGPITEVENRVMEGGSDDTTPGVDGEKKESQNDEMPLEQITAQFANTP